MSGRDKADQGKPDKEGAAGTELSEQLRRIDARLSDIRSERAAEQSPPKGLMADGTAMARGMKMVSEFIAGIAAGGLIGFLIDKMAGTQPFMLMIGLMFGFAAGLRNLYRASSGGNGQKP
jgi:ATP synthase protein I